jgi:hypothetical protein
MKDRKNRIDVSEIYRPQKYNLLGRTSMHFINITIDKSKKNIRPNISHFYRAFVILNTDMDSMSSLLKASDF